MWWVGDFLGVLLGSDSTANQGGWSSASFDAAIADAEETKRVSAAALALEIASIDTRSLRDITVAVNDIERAAEQLVGRYRALSDTDIAALARTVVAELTGLGAVS